MRTSIVAIVAIASGLAATTLPAAAQLSSQQQSAIRANCRSDFMSKCSGVTPGGKDALACLQNNVATLSSGCKAAVESTLPKPAASPPPAASAPPPAAQIKPAPPKPAAIAAPPPAAAAPTAAQQSEMKAACRSDFMSHCAGVAPGGRDALACLQRNVGALSSACKRVVGETMHGGAAPTHAAAPKPAPAKPVAAAPAPVAPTAAQQSEMKAACRSDFMSHCAGVAPGGRDALACLQRNVGALSSACKRVVGETMRGAAPAAAAPPPAPAAAMLPPGAGPTPAQLSAIKFTCRRDFSRDCKGIPPGGPEALACLERNMPRLSPNCRTSMAAVADELPPPDAMPPPPVAAPPPPHEPNPVDALVMVRACKLDLMRHCSNVPVGGGAKVACLEAHRDRLTFRCRSALKVSAPLR